MNTRENNSATKRPTYEVEWTGHYPNACVGTWHMRRNGVLIDDDLIGFNDGYDTTDARTYGTYKRWYFGGKSGWQELFEDYEDGLNFDEWSNENADWLKLIEPDKTFWPEIFEAFQSADWRSGECGGCI